MFKFIIFLIAIQSINARSKFPIRYKEGSDEFYKVYKTLWGGDIKARYFNNDLPYYKDYELSKEAPKCDEMSTCQ